MMKDVCVFDNKKKSVVGGAVCLTNRGYVCGETTETLRAESHGAIPIVAYAIDHVVLGGGNCTAEGPCHYEEVCPTLKAGGVHAVAYAVDCRNGTINPSTNGTLQSKPNGGGIV